MSLYNNYSSFGDKSCSCDCDSCYSTYGPDKVGNSCSLNSIRQTLLQIINTIKKINVLDFNVDIEITTKNGNVNVINLSTLNINNVTLTETTLVVGDFAISLCDVVKISIISSSVSNPIFYTTLVNSIKNITQNGSSGHSSYKNCGCSSSGCKDIKCAQEIQNYINKNINSIQSVGYNGNVSQLQNVTGINDITKVNVLDNATITTGSTPVLESASLETTPTSVLETANLVTDKTSVINNITSVSTEVVTEVALNNTSLLSRVTTQTTDVSGPITPTPTSVIKEVNTSEQQVVTQVETSTQNVITSVTPTSENVVTGFEDGTPITGVISNVNQINNITPSSIDIPSITSTGTGELIITIPQGAIDGTNPTEEKKFNVTVGGQNISFGGNNSKFVLDTNTNVLGGSTNSPQVTTITPLGSPKTDTFVKSIETTNANVINLVKPTTDTIKVIDKINNTNINNIENPTIVKVIETLDQTPEVVNTVTSVKTSDTGNLFKTTTVDVISSAKLETNNVDTISDVTLNTTTENVINTTTLNTSETSVINGITTSTQSVYTNSPENINGTVFAAGDGIMAVNNTNGDISVYAICDINTVTG